ncbi:MAG TPA: 1,2-phenylacetyl-CoA epoxidase subunit PaaD [Chitinophagaceae bacterium]|nr:1,2-phenylacetyl-CoA epoxidase subunit PaaD [Chitinophagaceae bacterium]
MVVEEKISREKVWQVLEQISDPEIPVLSIIDLGIVRDVKVSPMGGDLPVGQAGLEGVEVFITPTYSGCPAMDMIAINIRMELLHHGFENVKISQQLSPAWTTDWMTETGKEKLKSYGIAPPVGKVIDQQFLENMKVECPQCHSKNTKLLSEFGSTACKALFRCQDCKEPFDYFKCH